MKFITLRVGLHFGKCFYPLWLQVIALILHITASSCWPIHKDIPNPPCNTTFNGKSIRIIFKIGVNLAQTKTSFAIQWYIGHPESNTRENGVALQCNWLQETKPFCESGQNYRFLEHLLSDKVVIERTLIERNNVTYQFQVIPPARDKQAICTLHYNADDMQSAKTILLGPSPTSIISTRTNETEQGFTDDKRGLPPGTWILIVVAVIVFTAFGAFLGAVLAFTYRSRIQACLGICRCQHSSTAASTGTSQCSQDQTTAPLMYGENSSSPDSSLDSQNESKPCPPETKKSDTDTR